MDIEFHYYITFILCRKAGFNADDSFKLAYSSQYTDDNNNHYYVNYPDGGHFINEVSQTMDIRKPSSKREKIYPLFHFVPGGIQAEEACPIVCDEKKCFVTIPNSDNAVSLLKAALDSGNLYRMGIAIHAFADTWSHQNFLGLKNKANARNRINLIPNIGHADFIHEPDSIHNEWKENRLGDKVVTINNDERFLEAAKQIFIYLYRFKNEKSDDSAAVSKYNELKLEAQLKDAMDDSYWLPWNDDDARVKAYRKICSELGLKEYQYDPTYWRYNAIRKDESEFDNFDKYWVKENFLESDWYKFQTAVHAHRSYALDKFRPLYEQAGLYH